MIDKKRALDHLNGSKKMYTRLLRGFINEYEDMTDQVMDLLAREEWETARRQIHAMKGLAGNIGSKSLKEASQKLEAKIKERQADLLSEVKRFDQSLAGTIKEARQILKDQPKSVIRECAYVLGTCNYNRINQMFNEHKTALEKELEPHVWIQLKKRINNYDYEDAHQLLRDYDSE